MSPCLPVCAQDPAPRPRAGLPMAMLGISLVLALCNPAAAQTYEELKHWCFELSTDDQTVRGCDAVIGSASASEVEKADAFDNRADAYNRMHQYDRAIEDYTRTIELEHDFSPAYLGRGNAYDAKGQSLRAIKDFDRAIELKPTYIEAFFNRGNAYRSV